MKKIIILFLAIAFCMFSPSYAENIEIQPTMNWRTNAQDRVWVGTFQLAWNDFINKVVFNPIRFREGTPLLVTELNKQSFTTDDISEVSYYRYIGKVGKKTKKQISKAIKKKFKETSDILDKLELTPRNDMFLIYVMLKKDFEFIREFSDLERSVFGKDMVAEYFGIDKNSDKSLARGVNVLFYNNLNDYAVALDTKTNDEVILYKNATNKPFNLLYADILKKQSTYKGSKTFGTLDELKVPNIKFFEEKSFDELSYKRIMGTNMVINKAVESINFDMNKKGVKLKSEGALTAVTTSLNPEDLSPRLFFFDDTFVIFLKEKNKTKPYFALRVNDIRKFQKN